MPTDPIERAARRLLASSQRRERFFESTLFRDPAWDIMLDLFLAQCRGEQASLARACAIAGVPNATAVRIVQYLVQTGLVAQDAGSADRPIDSLALTAEGNSGMRGFLIEESGAA